MKLEDEKTDARHFFSVGYDNRSKGYLLSIVVSYIGWFNRYYKITKEEYAWFDEEHERLVALMRECEAQNIHHPRFFFSEFDADNTEEQEKLKWSYLGQDAAQERRFNNA